MTTNNEKKKYSKKKTTKPKSSDAVNHPSHYQKEGKECIQWMEEIYGKISVYFFCILNSYKYTFRAGSKDNNPAEQDYKKSEWYINYSKNLYNRMNYLERLIIKILSIKC